LFVMASASQGSVSIFPLFTQEMSPMGWSQMEGSGPRL
jgi:hypothetical protein